MPQRPLPADAPAAPPASSVARADLFPGFTDERYYLYLATGLEQVDPAPDHDGGEPISAEWLRLDAAVDAVTTGKIVDAKTALGLLLARLKDQR